MTSTTYSFDPLKCTHFKMAQDGIGQALVFRHSSFVIDSDFDICHSSFLRFLILTER
jgi:hypothetical protein